MMKKIPFYKMSGSGNDFVIIDNRADILGDIDLKAFILKVCRRRMSAGADGMILIENSDELDFQWRFFNSDGSRAEMCGNGARCAARFAFLNGIAGPEMVFGTDVGPIQAAVGNHQVKVRMTDPSAHRLSMELDIGGRPLSMDALNTGVPHAVIQVDDIESADVCGIGREVRNHAAFAPAGTNVNFTAPGAEGAVYIRTYERGVEDETLACGTGAVAGALVHALRTGAQSPVKMMTRSGGCLTIHFQRQAEVCTHVYMEGDARVIYTADLCPDGWQY